MLRKRSQRLIEAERNNKRQRTNEGGTERIGHDWISATEIRYCVMDNVMVDWLRLYGKKKNYKPENPKPNEGTEIMKMGIVYEDKIVELIKSKIKNTVTIGSGWQSAVTLSSGQETIDAMTQGIPVIFQGVLHNHINKTYGMPDILVRSDYINQLTDFPVLQEDEINKSSLFSDHYHYRVIDIKFTTLNLAADQIHLLNDTNFKFYKCQLQVYNDALSIIQEYNPGKAYLLGRRWKSTSKGDKLGENHCFSKLATVDYLDRDESFIELTKTSIEQRRLLKTEGSSWSVDPPSNNMLFPNMCIKSDYDYPWHDVKKEIAKRNEEITLIYNCGTPHRQNAQKKGITKWTDPLCTSENLGINGVKMGPIIDAMLLTNRNPDPNHLIDPKIIKNNKQNWQVKDDLELFVDFETANDLSMEDFSDLPYAKTGSRIFLIGVFWIDPMIGQEQFRYFVADDLTLESERINVQSFVDFVASLAQQHNKKIEDVKIFHWGHIERTEFASATKRHQESWTRYNWLDFCDVMRSEPIVMKGSFKFGLKEIGRKLYDAKLIKTTWASDTESGKDALLQVKKCNNESEIVGESMRFHKDMKDIILYNYYDCKVTYEVIDYFRNNHIKKILA